MGWPSISTNWAEAHWDSWPGPSFFSQISSSSSFSIALKFLLRVSSLKGTLMTCANLTKFWALTLALPNAISLSFPKHLLLTFKLVFNTPFLAFSVFGFGIANVGSFLEVFFLSFRVFRACSKKIRKKKVISIFYSVSNYIVPVTLLGACFLIIGMMIVDELRKFHAHQPLKKLNPGLVTCLKMVWIG